MSEANPFQCAACVTVGTKQCAAICLFHSSNITLGECPEITRVWTKAAILREMYRRPDGFTGVARDGIEAQHGLNDTYPRTPSLRTFLRQG